MNIEILVVSKIINITYIIIKIIIEVLPLTVFKIEHKLRKYISSCITEYLKFNANNAHKFNIINLLLSECLIGI